MSGNNKVYNWWFIKGIVLRTIYNTIILVRSVFGWNLLDKEKI